MSLKISIDRPYGFIESKQFRGFEQPSTGASIMVQELPAPYGEIVASMSEDRLSQRGMTLIERESIERDDYTVVLLHARQEVADNRFDKWISIQGTDQMTVIATCCVPDRMSNELSDEMREVALSVECDFDNPLPDFGVLPTSAVPELKFASRFGEQLIYTRSGDFPITSPDEPCFVAGYESIAVPLRGISNYACLRLRQAPDVSEPKIELSESVTIDGLTGHEILATDISAKHQFTVVVYLAILCDGEQSFVMQGLAGGAFCEECRDVFPRMARGFLRQEDELVPTFQATGTKRPPRDSFATD